jgi:hypothetical protein
MHRPPRTNRVASLLSRSRYPILGLGVCWLLVNLAGRFTSKASPIVDSGCFLKSDPIFASLDFSEAPPVNIATFHSGFKEATSWSLKSLILGKEAAHEPVPFPSTYWNWRHSVHAAGFDPGHVLTVGRSTSWGPDESANWRNRASKYRLIAQTLDPDAILVSRRFHFLPKYLCKYVANDVHESHSCGVLRLRC